jgi:hypothetical protein
MGEHIQLLASAHSEDDNGDSPRWWRPEPSIKALASHAFSEGPVWMKVPAAIRYTVTTEK